VTFVVGLMKDMRNEMEAMLSVMRWGMISVFGTVRGCLKVTGRKIVQRGIRKSVFLLSVLKRCL